MSATKFLFPPMLALGLGGLPQTAAAQQVTATITKDETNEYSCAARKRVAVVVNASRELLPEERYQYALGGGLHVVCADYSGTALQVGRKVKIALSDSKVTVLP